MFWFILIGFGLLLAFSIMGAAKKAEEVRKREEFNASRKRV